MSHDLDNDLVVLLHEVARQTRTRADHMAGTLGLTRAQLIVLARLELQPNVSQNELAAAAEVAPTTIARLIDRLEQIGLVERTHDPTDRRIWRLQLTQAAAPVLGEIDRFRADLRGLLTRGVDPSALAATIRALQQMKENVSARRLTASADFKEHDNE